ncbi:MAG: PKD domain-containing protein [Thermoanaerobaculia bacterium]|nr:PKD domain-containing protein [Thermoanaerobaculia bacterium]
MSERLSRSSLPIFAAGFLATLGLLSANPSWSGTIDPVLTPHRASGAGPLAVVFDTTGTTASTTSRPFHELDYAWNFGDPASGTWQTTGRSRDRGRGPVTGHVFEPDFEPGEASRDFLVTLTVRDADGDMASTTTTITV